MQLFRAAVHGMTAIALLLTASQAGCRFKPDVAPLVISTLPPSAFGGFSSDSGGTAESPEAAMERLLDELLDPFNMPLGMTYIGSVHEAADEVLAGAYAYYGYDLEELAASRQDNPLTEEMFRDYLERQGVRWITDPATGENFDVYAWLVQDRGVEARGVVPQLVLTRIGGLDAENVMNYERNYLRALYDTYPEEVLATRYDFANQLLELYENDAAAVYEHLQKLDLVGTGD
jgi:hypothetical protein